MHAHDDLELFVIGALPGADAARVREHLASCAECRLTAATLGDVVAALPDTVEPREPTAALRRRILSAAMQERAAARPPLLPAFRWMRSTGFVLASLGFTVVLLGGATFGEYQALQTAHDEKTKLQEAATSDRSWYMSAANAQWNGSGGTFTTKDDGTARVLFHDLRPLTENSQYALWLVSPGGRWTRGATFKSDGQKLQTVEVNVNPAALTDFARRLVTVDEGTNTRPPAQTVVMQWSAK